MIEIPTYIVAGYAAGFATVAIALTLFVDIRGTTQSDSLNRFDKFVLIAFVSSAWPQFIVLAVLFILRHKILKRSKY